MDLKSTCDSKMHYIVFTTTINDNFGIHDFYPVLPMGKTYPFTHFHPVLPNRFYPVGKTYHANPGYKSAVVYQISSKSDDFSLRYMAISRFSRWQISATLNYRGAIMVHCKAHVGLCIGRQ